MILIHILRDYQKYNRIRIDSINIKPTTRWKYSLVTFLPFSFPLHDTTHLTTRIQLFNVSFDDDVALKKFGEDKKLADRCVFIRPIFYYTINVAILMFGNSLHNIYLGEKLRFPSKFRADYFEEYV